jgi:hypothetical protein
MREHAVEHGLSYTFAKRFHGARWWTDRNWYLAIDLNHSDQRPLLLLERTVLRGSHLLSSDEEPDPGVGQANLRGYTDADGDWPSTTSAPLLDRQRSAARRSGLPHPDLVTNDDGSVDLHIGPTRSAGRSRTGSKPFPV